MNPNHLKNLARRRKRRLRLPADAACLLCGQREIPALIPTPGRLIQAHHLLGWEIAPDVTVPLCQTCHAIATAQLQDAGVDMTSPPSALERAIHVLRALAVAFESICHLLAQLIQDLAFFLEQLQARHPDWRTWEMVEP
jgi:hypothetical protein